MPVLIMISHALQAIVFDAAQSAAKEHIIKAIDEHLSYDAKKELDEAIMEDGTHVNNSLGELLNND